MAKKCLMLKALQTPKFKVRRYCRCQRCGRSRAYMRKFKLCRICFRELAANGQVPGLMKASW